MFTEGKYKILYIKKSDGEYYPIGCLTENSFSERVDMLPTTTRDNVNGWRSSIPVGQSYGINFSGVLSYGTESVNITYKELTVIKRNRERIEWKIEDVQTNEVDFGKGYIIDISNSASVEDFVVFSGNITGFGIPEETIIDCVGDVVETNVAVCGIFE